jgi:hypothetical protein
MQIRGPSEKRLRVKKLDLLAPFFINEAAGNYPYGNDG